MALRVGVGPWCRVGPSSLESGLAALCGYNFYDNYKHTMTNISEGGGKKKTGVGPSFSVLKLALRGGVGSFGRGWPFLLGVGVGRPLSWAGVGRRGWPFSG